MHYSPLRYPGGKAKLSEWFVNLMRQNRISGGHYVEPYAGGGGVALYLLIRGIVDKIHINDIDSGVYLFWYHVLNHTEDFINLVNITPVSIEQWHHQREVLANPSSYSELEIAFAFFFLNRSNRSGILKGGVIGGLEQKGVYKIDARFNKPPLIDRIAKIANFKKHITLTNIDSSKLLDEYANCSNPRSLIYLDPPYYEKGQKLYLNAYTDKDHQEIALKVKSLKTPWVITYDNHPRIRELYHWTKAHKNTIQYSAQQRRLETELVYCGNMKFHRTTK